MENARRGGQGKREGTENDHGKGRGIREDEGNMPA